jgi:hypothetical protein
MRSDKYLWNVCMKMYRAMYKKADPPANIDKLIKEGKTREHDWWRNHCLAQEEQDKIVNRIAKQHKITAKERKKIDFEMCLGASPISVSPEEVKKNKIRPKKVAKNACTNRREALKRSKDSKRSK